MTLDKLNDAIDAYATENGDGFSARDYLGAHDYKAEGFALAEQAFEMAEEDRADWIDAEVYAFPESTRYLVGVAADYRLCELRAAEIRRDSWFFKASDISLAPFNGGRDVSGWR